MARRGGYRSGYSRWDRRDIGLKPENALSRVARKFSHSSHPRPTLLLVFAACSPPVRDPLRLQSSDVIPRYTHYFSIPCTELVEVGEVSDANQALYDIITDNQTRRRQWSKTYEGIMLKLMELSVDLRKPGMVKEALHKYRAMCMQSNVSSLEDVVRFLIDLAEKRTEAARKKVDETILEGAEDLEDGAMETPETLLLEAAGHALTKERVDRQQVVPWMRFLWEVYRVVLDIVKTHNKLEVCYHGMATKAFTFCIKYKRYMEFRRLCDMLRQHLNQLINNPRNSPNDVKITDADTLQKFLETRFTQLSTAVSLEHWQEAYRTIEDIHMIMMMGKAKAKPQHMSIYYDKLMQVFWVSGNYLYHAHALYKLYTLSVKQNRNLSAEDAQTMASRLLLASLSIPVYDAQSAVLSDSYGIMTDVLGTPTSENAARHARMASLLGYSSAAERGSLISELLSKGVGRACHPELGDLHDLLEGEMAPLQFSDRFKKILEFVNSHEVLKEYATPLRRVGIFRLLEQLGRVYDVMRLDDMKKVASFAEYTEVEDTALTALKTRSLAVRFDYQNQCLRFESELFSTDGMRTQLGRLARRMALTSDMLTENALVSAATASDKEVVAISLEKEKKAAARRKMAIATAKSAAAQEEKDILSRRGLIERRKEEAERRTAEAVRQKKLAAAREIALAEQRRKQEEAKRRYEEQQRQAQAPVEASAGDVITSGGVVGAEGEGDAEREERMTREKEKELKEQAEMKKRIHQLASHLNYIERANREAQWSLLREAHVKEAESQSRLTEEIAAKELEEAKAHHSRALEDKGRTTRIMASLQGYLQGLMARVDNDFEMWAEKEKERAEAQAAKEAELAAARAAEEARLQAQREKEDRIAREEAEAAEAAAKEVKDKAREAAQRAEHERQRSLEGPAPSSTGKYKPGAFGRRLVPVPTVAAGGPDAASPASRPSGIGGTSPFGQRSGARPTLGTSGLRAGAGAREERAYPLSSTPSADASGISTMAPSFRNKVARDPREQLPGPNAANTPSTTSAGPPQRKRFYSSKKKPANP